MPSATDSPLARRVNLALLALLMLVTFGVRVWYVATQPAPALVYDEAGYDASARRLVDTGTYAYPRYLFTQDGRLTQPMYQRFLEFQRSDAWSAPGYAGFLAVIYRMAGTGPQRLVAARLAQVLLSVLTLLLLWDIGRRLGSRWIGLLGAALVALYPPYTYAVADIMTETFYTFLLVACVLVTLVALERRSWRWFLGAGVLTMLAAFVRPVGLLWPAFMVLYMLLHRGFRLAEAARYTAVFAAGVLLLLVPWWARNYAVYHRFIPLTTSSANTVVAATSARYEAGGRPSAEYPPAIQWDDLKLNDYWAKLGRERIAERLRDRPLWLVRFRATQALAAMERWWPGDPPLAVRRPRLQRFEAAWHALLWWLFAAGALMALLRRDGKALLVASLVPYFIVVHAATMPLARYLQPIMATNALAGAYGLVMAAGWAYGLFVRRRVPAEPEPLPAEPVEESAGEAG